VGSRDGGSVSDEDDSPIHHVGRSEVADCLGEWLRSRFDNFAERRRKQVLRVAVKICDPFVCQQTFGDRVATRTTFAIGHDPRQQMLVGDAVPDPVVQPVAWADVVMLDGDEIAEDVGAYVVGEAEVTVKRLARGRRHCAFREESSPSEIAGIGRPHGRPELLAHDGVPAVGTDQKIARFSGSILELRGYRPRAEVLIDLHQRLHVMIVLFAEGRLQGRIDERPGCLGLRGEVLGLDRSVGPEDGAVRGPYTKLDGSKIDACPPEDLDHLGLKNDAAAAAIEIVGRALEDVDIPTDSAQQVSREEPA
jgi:hypothetical protein